MQRPRRVLFEVPLATSEQNARDYRRRLQWKIRVSQWEFVMTEESLRSSTAMEKIGFYTQEKKWGVLRKTAEEKGRRLQLRL